MGTTGQLNKFYKELNKYFSSPRHIVFLYNKNICWGCMGFGRPGVAIFEFLMSGNTCSNQTKLIYMNPPTLLVRGVSNAGCMQPVCILFDVLAQYIPPTLLACFGACQCTIL